MRSTLTALIGLLWAVLAAAHPMPESRAWLDTTPTGLRLTLQLPLNRLEFAYGQPLADAPAQVLSRHGEGLATYLLQHVGARSGQQGWQVLRPQLSVQGADRAAELEAVLDLRAPPAADPRHFTLLLDAVVHEVRTHRIQVLLRQDWQGGQAGAPPLLLGELDSQRLSLPITLKPASQWNSLRSLFRQGATHIAEGTDHLLFLLTLLLVAPLLQQGHRWVGTRPASKAWRRLVVVVSAFTVGHSLTLALASSGVLALPGQWAEVVVAASIVLAALHAWRPLIPAGEVWMAGAFGLLHGLAFAASLNSAGLSVAQHAQALLAFNLGIEAVQLLVVAAAMPPLLALAQWAPGFYAHLRQVLAGLTAVLAMGWLVQRLLPQSELMGRWADALAAAGPAVVALLWLAAAVVGWRRRSRGAAILSATQTQGPMRTHTLPQTHVQPTERAL